MSLRSADQIRSEFLEFFRARGHVIVPSSPVVPHDDPTLMFANAGMNQFKPIFLGQADPNSAFGRLKRAADTQKCIRAGGKHNDLDDVGHDTYHHTFFEMLGNWSFGDYFKKEAIAWAWELLTGVWGIDKRRLHATYFQGDAQEGLDADTEARDLWTSVTDIDPTHVHPGNKKDNFWEMGDTGPCGPCSEIHIDLTPDLSGGRLVNAGDARVIEIWNLVFIQFNRGPDGKLSPLPARHVDTGMGFERITAVLQGKNSNYDTDVFAPIFAGIRRVTGAPAYTGLLESDAIPDSTRGREETVATRTAVMKDIAYRVIADHIRTLTFALTDGAVPSNEGRGYVLRRILRRAVRYGRQYLNVHKPFLCDLAPVVVDAMGHAFPELKTDPARVAALIREEEESFIRTLDRGIALFEEAADRAQQSGRKAISGQDAFKLHDTYGFPIDLTEIMARERGMGVETAEYERLMEDAREKARSAGKMTQDFVLAALRSALTDSRLPRRIPSTDDSFKYETDSLTARVLWAAPYEADDSAGMATVSAPGSARAGQTAFLVVDRTCFYGEQGGQVGDQGEIIAPQARFLVDSTFRVDDYVVHVGTVQQGELHERDEVELRLSPLRGPTMQNHTATHVLNWALREVLEIGGGGKVDQKGSLVDPEKTRFDFSHNKPLTPEEIERIESLCAEQIRADYPVYTREVPQAEARKINTLRAVFGEKYPDVVRVVSIGADIDAMLKDPRNPAWMKYSVEFCGGTHLKRTREIGSFVLVAEESVAKGIRRVIGVSGGKAEAAIQAGRELRALAERLRSAPVDQLPAGLADLQKRMADAEIPLRDRFALREAVAELQNTLKRQGKQQAAQSAGAIREARRNLLEAAVRINGTAVIVGELPDAPVEQIREAADWLRTQAGSAAVCLGTRPGGKPLILAALTDDLVARGLKAGDLIKQIAPAIDGKGGGKPQLAQAGGTNPEGLAKALAQAAEWYQSRLA
ncbi:MAG: alanine--tRNA ligase [Phycisphaerae bacterium]|jgi:alanyl-tRNA synthetase